MLSRLLLLVLLSLPLAAPALAQSAVDRARELAAAGQRGRAIALLQQRLTESPGDTDARTLYGTVLSWEGRHDEAREALVAVLEGNPTHGDALPALANVELWSGNYARAEELAARAVAAMPERWDVRVQHARALDRLDRLEEARDELDRAVSLNPDRQDVRAYRRALNDRMARWSAGVSYGLEMFDKGRNPWHEAQLSLSRQTRAGSFGVRGYHAERFGFDDQQIELEAYPYFRDGTYGYAAAAFADETSLYPKRRYAADLYQSLGGGFEGSMGARRLEFTDTIHVYVASLAKYQGNYLLQSRVFYTPGDSASITWQAGGRRYFADGVSYVGMRYSQGSWRDDIRDVADLDRLGSHSLTIDAAVDVGRVTVSFNSAFGREDRANLSAFTRGSFGMGLKARF